MNKSFAALIVPALAVALITGCASNRPTPTATPDQMQDAWEGEDIMLAPLPGEMAYIEPNPEDALVLQDIHFAFDSSEVLPDEQVILEGISDWMIGHPDALLRVEGHCDERGTREYNTALGERRALAVRSSLTGLGTNPDRITTASYGEDMLLCVEDTEECHSRNRRAHFKVDYGTEEAAVAGGEIPEPIVLDEVVTETEEVVIYEEPVPVPEEEPPAPPEMPEESETAAPRQRVMGRYHY